MDFRYLKWIKLISGILMLASVPIALMEMGSINRMQVLLPLVFIGQIVGGVWFIVTWDLKDK